MVATTVTVLIIVNMNYDKQINFKFYNNLFFVVPLISVMRSNFKLFKVILIC